MASIKIYNNNLVVWDKNDPAFQDSSIVLWLISSTAKRKSVQILPQERKTVISSKAVNVRMAQKILSRVAIMNWSTKL